MKHFATLSIFFCFHLTLSAAGQSPVPLSTPAVISPETQNIIDDNTPEMLPQKPIAKNRRSDAEADNLKGKVRTVVVEREIVGDQHSRYITSIEGFDRHGNLVKSIAFDWAHNPWRIMVYGFIDGARVSSSKYIRHDYDPPPMAAPRNAPNAPPEPQRDMRYELKYENKLTDGKVTEETLFGNSGKLLTRTVYNWKTDHQVEKLVYTSNGDLNQKYVRTYDKSGNEIDQFNPDLIPGKPYGDRRFVTIYDQFDKVGNWIKKTVVMYNVLDNGTELQNSAYVQYRTITYYD